MNMAAAGRFADLGPRVVSALVLLVLGGGAVWVGGNWFLGFVALSVALMLWELLRMLAPGRAVGVLVMLAALGGGAVIMTAGQGPLPILLGAALPVALTLALPPEPRPWFAFYGTMLVLAGEALVSLRGGVGLVGVIWLVLVVISSDVMGYFAGKALGGPKFWPRVSPKKTWSGTVAGWIGAAGVGALFAGSVAAAGGAAGLAVISVAVAMAGQAGDILESALKRRAGVKDSSGLIPGHGGFLDRFDAMMAAALMVFVLERLGLFATVTVQG